MSSVLGIGTAQSRTVAESLTFHPSIQVNRNQSAKEIILLHVLLTKDVLLSLLSLALKGLCAEVFAAVQTGLAVKWDLLVQVLLDTASDLH